jgi:Cyclin, N-terminal domain
VLAPSTPASPKPDPFYGHEYIARLCSRFVTHLFACPEYPPSSTNPQVKLPYFIAYALHRTKLHQSVMFAALVLLQRLKARFPTARGSSGHRLFISAFMIASKVICDDTYSNKSWSIVAQGMFTLREINQMEREMCSYLEWELTVDGSILANFEAMVKRDFRGPGPYPTYSLQMVSKKLQKSPSQAVLAGSQKFSSYISSYSSNTSPVSSLDQHNPSPPKLLQVPPPESGTTSYTTAPFPTSPSNSALPPSSATPSGIANLPISPPNTQRFDIRGSAINSIGQDQHNHNIGQDQHNHNIVIHNTSAGDPVCLHTFTLKNGRLHAIFSVVVPAHKARDQAISTLLWTKGLGILDHDHIRHVATAAPRRNIDSAGQLENLTLFAVEMYVHGCAFRLVFDLLITSLAPHFVDAVFQDSALLVDFRFLVLWIWSSHCIYSHIGIYSCIGTHHTSCHLTHYNLTVHLSFPIATRYYSYILNVTLLS